MANKLRILFPVLFLILYATAVGGGNLVVAADFTSIDSHALAAPKSAEKNLKSLSHYLTKPAKNDTEKARAIYMWITDRVTYDWDAFRSGRYGSQDAGAVLKRRRAVCHGYATLYKDLGEMAGLEVETVVGNAKGYGYKPGDKIKKTGSGREYTKEDVAAAYDKAYKEGRIAKGERVLTIPSTGASSPFGHAWNAVRIDGRWRLLDSTWGAVDLASLGKGANSEKPYLDHFFLTPPEELIFNHYPDDDKWQLIDKPISIVDFIDSPMLMAGFFKYKMEAVSPKTTVFTSPLPATLVVKAPGEVMVSVRLRDPESGRELMAKGKGSMGTHPLTFSQLEGTAYRLYVKYPKKGEYLAEVYGGLKEGKDGRGHFEMVATYLLKGTEAASADAAYPVQYFVYFRKNARLHEPMEGYLKLGTVQAFRISAPGAEKVAVVVGEKWNFLEKKKGEVFSGDALLDNDKVVVYANYGEKNWAGLLAYTAR